MPTIQPRRLDAAEAHLIACEVAEHTGARPEDLVETIQLAAPAVIDQAIPPAVREVLALLGEGSPFAGLVTEQAGQRHGTGSPAWVTQATNAVNQRARAAAGHGGLSWRTVMQADVMQAFAARDLYHLRRHLLAVAVTALEWAAELPVQRPAAPAQPQRKKPPTARASAVVAFSERKEQA